MKCSPETFNKDNCADCESYDECVKPATTDSDKAFEEYCGECEYNAGCEEDYRHKIQKQRCKQLWQACSWWQKGQAKKLIEVQRKLINKYIAEITELKAQREVDEKERKELLSGATDNILELGNRIKELEQTIKDKDEEIRNLQHAIDNGVLKISDRKLQAKIQELDAKVKFIDDRYKAEYKSVEILSAQLKDKDREIRVLSCNHSRDYYGVCELCGDGMTQEILDQLKRGE